MAEETVEVEVGNIIIATGYDAFDPTPLHHYGYGRLDNVITALEFERMINASGPTAGEVLLKDGSHPKTIGIIHCVGSRDKKYHEYCSQVCCMYSMKFGHLIREHVPGAQVYEFYIDLRCVGKAFEEFYNRVLDEGTTFIRGRPAEVTDVAESPEEGKLIIVSEDTLIGRQRRIPVDMVVLSTALQPRADVEEVARRFSIGRSADGFFLEKHPKLDPVATMSDGIFVVGCCQSPKDIPQSVVQASAAAARALATISAGSIEIEATTATIVEELCSGCKTCSALCPYNAISFDEEEKVSHINEAVCKGCGVCVAACPSGAIVGKHFTTEELMAEIEGVLV
jgi:heterodisulfide reductase subunit A